MRKPINKILIAGYGRSGTSFIIQLLTRLGFDTGFEPYKEHIDKSKRAGCERMTSIQGTDDDIIKVFENTPYILKAPAYSMIFKELSMRNILKVDYMFIPVRDLGKAAESRIDVGLNWIIKYVDSNAPDYAKQVASNAIALGACVEGCMVLNIPFVLMRFPDLVKNEKYCYDSLTRVFEINKKKFHKIFQELSNPDSIKIK